jgi:hypothetical protein
MLAPAFHPCQVMFVLHSFTGEAAKIRLYVMIFTVLGDIIRTASLATGNCFHIRGEKRIGNCYYVLYDE